MSHIQKCRGVTLFEAVLALVVIGILISVIFPLTLGDLDDRRRDQTLEQLKRLKLAMLGDPRIITKEARISFGYLGDFGSLPANLEDLWIKGSQPSYANDTTLKGGSGWAGPYIELGFSQRIDDLKTDAWGSTIIWTRPEETNARGQLVKGRLRSIGPNKIEGDNDDLVLEIVEGEMLSRVLGYVRDGVGNLMPNATVKINHPVNGSLVMAETQTDSQGAYSFDNISFGNRSVTVLPRLIAVPESAVVTASKNDVEVLLQNFNSNNITVNSMTAFYNRTAFYERVAFANTTVFNYVNNSSVRKGSGELVTFATPVTINGTGSISGETFPIRLQSPITQVADIGIGSAAKKGATVKLTLYGFKDSQTGTGLSVDMTSTDFELRLDDGSIVFFSPTAK